MRVRDCKKCREETYKEACKEYLKGQYAWFKDAAYSMACFATVCALCVMHKRGRSKDYIRKFFEDMCFICDFPEILGKRVDMLEMMHFFEKEYGIDFKKIKIHLETEEEFIKSAKKRNKAA